MGDIVAEYIEGSVFSDRISGDVPVVVDFTASWCGPCKLVGPLMDRLAGEYDGKAKVFKLDIDKNKTLAREYGIKSIPAVLLFKNGELVETVVGVKAYQEFSSKLEALI
ncbi:MAG: thioredoxin [Symploca sp. SIO2B6]|nr:thioredoxin [Symploca sp. SIO2B6]